VCSPNRHFAQQDNLRSGHWQQQVKCLGQFLFVHVTVTLHESVPLLAVGRFMARVGKRDEPTTTLASLETPTLTQWSDLYRTGQWTSESVSQTPGNVVLNLLQVRAYIDLTNHVTITLHERAFHFFAVERTQSRFGFCRFGLKKHSPIANVYDRRRHPPHCFRRSLRTAALSLRAQHDLQGRSDTHMNGSYDCDCLTLKKIARPSLPI
jgi:hypothetical protein